MLKPPGASHRETATNFACQKRSTTRQWLNYARRRGVRAASPIPKHLLPAVAIREADCRQHWRQRLQKSTGTCSTRPSDRAAIVRPSCQAGKSRSTRSCRSTRRKCITTQRPFELDLHRAPCVNKQSLFRLGRLRLPPPALTANSAPIPWRAAARRRLCQPNSIALNWL